MKRVVIIYESIYGNTKRLAETISEGIQSAGHINCLLKKTSDIHTDELSEYDGILLGAPNHNQEPARNIVRYIDRAAIVGIKGKIGAAFDTYTGGNKGIAVSKLENLLKEKLPGIELVMEGLSALVEDRKGPLAEEEFVKAHEFGYQFGQRLIQE